jgi:hypothetical protein
MAVGHTAVVAVVVATAVAMVLATTTTSTHAAGAAHVDEAAFVEWAHRFGREYVSSPASGEYAAALAAFRVNAQRVAQLQARGDKTASLTDSPFADVAAEVFREQRLMPVARRHPVFESAR